MERRKPLEAIRHTSGVPFISLVSWKTGGGSGDARRLLGPGVFEPAESQRGAKSSQEKQTLIVRTHSRTSAWSGARRFRAIRPVFSVLWRLRKRTRRRCQRTIGSGTNVNQFRRYGARTFIVAVHGFLRWRMFALFGGIFGLIFFEGEDYASVGVLQLS